MDVLTVAASGLPVGRVALVAVVLLVIYGVAVVVYPFTAHGRCNGTGKLRSPSGTKWRRCPGCKGTGTKLRIGRRLFNATTRRQP